MSFRTKIRKKLMNSFRKNAAYMSQPFFFFFGGGIRKNFDLIVRHFLGNVRSVLGHFYEL